MITGILIGIGCLAVGGIALLILIFTSIKTLEVNEVGLDYSGITKTIDSDIYGAGIHLLGVGHSFIIYPTTVQHYEFSRTKGADGPKIRSRTKEGLEVELEISFQYIYQVNKVYELYMRFAENYKEP